MVDQVIQQAVIQELIPIHEEQFSESSFGFCQGRGQYDALRQCQRNANDGYVYVVDMDLEKFFGTVCQSKRIEVLSRTIRDGRAISLIHKYLNAGVLVNGMFERAEIGMPQGGLHSLLSSNIMLNELDKEFRRRGYRFYRYKGKCRFRLDPKSVTKMRNKIRELMDRNNGMGNTEREEKYQQYVRG